MSYRSTYLNQFSLTRAAFLPNLWSELVAMGWTLFDGGLPTYSVPYTDVNISANTITVVGHTFSNGNRIIYIQGATVIGGLNNNTLYYIVNVSGDTFQVSTTQGGGAVDLTSQGSGNHTFGEGFRVYSSNGESADRITEYVQIFITTANTISSQAYYSWNASTHVGVGASTSTADITTSESGFYAWIYGNKNIVALHTKVSTTYYFTGFGHLTKRFWTTLTSLTSGATSGTNVVIDVASTTNFYVDKYYQIVGATNEGRDKVLVTAKTSNTLTISNLPRNYSSGSFIGQCPSTFGNFSTSHTFYPTCSWTSVGTAIATASTGLVDVITEAYVNPDARAESRYLLQPLIYAESLSGNMNTFGYIDEYIFNTGATGKTTEDTIGVGFQDSGTSTGSNTPTTLNDTGKTWTINAWATKVIIITNGTGAGQIRKIASNTATEITLVLAWTTTPDVSSTYSVYDEGYRYFATGNACAYREGN